MIDSSLFRDAKDTALSVVGVRYASWSAIDRPICCGAIDFSTQPCPPNVCPLSGSKSDLPAMPFESEIVDGHCKCLDPQTCDQRSALGLMIKTEDEGVKWCPHPLRHAAAGWTASRRMETSQRDPGQ